MKIYATDKLNEGSSLAFTPTEFKKWADDIYNKYKDTNDVEIYLTSDVFYEWGEEYSTLVVEANYEREENEAEKKERLEAEEDNMRNNFAIKFMDIHNIPNRFGTQGFLTMLEDGYLKYTTKEFEEFIKQNS